MLAALERELADEPVVVVGVHSPKFPTEADASMVRDAVRRHGITHPVVIDEGQALWSQYAVRAWPTLVVVGPDGVIVGASSGEPDLQPLLTVVRGVMAAHADVLVTESERPIPLRVELPPPGNLAYPGGIAIAPDGGIWVADTGHHQLVELDPDGVERRRLGTGRPALRDGAGDATFHNPHGLVVDGDRLVIADTGNHAVRAVDLASGAVTTLAGTGRRGRSFDAGPARGTDLRSPWDVAVHPGGGIVVAMAGSHQLWGIQDGVTAVLAGSGREARVDGDAQTAAFAQPSGLAWGPPMDGLPALYVADSEISAVRRLHDGSVVTVAGGDLFAFGAVDGQGDAVRFQHPVGIGEGPDGTLLVADTLNHSIRALDPTSGAVTTLLGDGTPFDAGLAALEHRPPVPADARDQSCLREPEAVVADGDRILVADTGNHRILAVDRATGRAEVLAGRVEKPDVA